MREWSITGVVVAVMTFGCGGTTLAPAVDRAQPPSAGGAGGGPQPSAPPPAAAPAATTTGEEAAGPGRRPAASQPVGKAQVVAAGAPATKAGAPPAALKAPEGLANLDDDIMVEVRAEPYETFVDMHVRGHARPSLDFRLKARRVSITWDRSRPQQGQVADVTRMLTRLYRGYGRATPPQRLLMSLDYYGYPDYVERLARHAAADRRWLDQWQRGRKPTRPRGVSRVMALHDYIEETTRSQQLHPELDAVFQAVGQRVTLGSVEKCSVARPRTRGEPGQWLAERKVPGHVKLPVGCSMVYFRLEPLK